jgi:hypothetical protein
MMRFIGLLSTAMLIFVIGCGSGAYFVGKYAYIAGAQAAYSRCLERSGNRAIETPDYKTFASRRIRCGASVLLSHGLDR